MTDYTKLIEQEIKMLRLKYPFGHEWHVAINKHADELRASGGEHPSFMYEAKRVADEVPRMIALFKSERLGDLPKQHQQCSRSKPVPIEDNALTCCLGVQCKECPSLLALENIERTTEDDINTAKAWTCATHIVSKGGDFMGEGYLLTKSDRMFWDNVHKSLSHMA